MEVMYNVLNISNLYFLKSKKVCMYMVSFPKSGHIKLWLAVYTFTVSIEIVNRIQQEFTVISI